jgi:hypothetical protein
VLGFTTHLVGIQGSPGKAYVCDTGIGFSWISTNNGTAGGIAVLQSTAPPDSNGTGGIAVTAYSDSPPSSSVPMLVGSDQLSVGVSSLSKTSAVVTLINVSGTEIDGPFQIVLDSLTSGVTVANAAGIFGGWSYITVPDAPSLNPGKAVSVTIQFTNPSNATVGFAPIAYSGEMD